MKKGKILLLLCILNLDLLMLSYLLSPDNGTNNSSTIEILEERSDIRAEKLYQLSISLSNKYGQSEPTCFKNDLLGFDNLEKAYFYRDQGQLVLGVISGSEEYILNCESGNMFRSFANSEGVEKTKRIDVDGYLWEELNKNAIDFEMIQMVIDLMLNYADISNRPLRGWIKMVYREYEKEDGFEIEALQFKIKGRREVTIFKHNENQITRYYDQGYVYTSSLINKAPVKYGIITSWYDKERIHPLTKENKPHFGTDYAGTLGDPVYAVSSGHIDKMEFKRNNGNYVKIDHGRGIFSQYLHLDRFKKNIGVGDFVQKNDIIGYIGMTGLATAPHVCYRFWENGRQINHLNYLGKGSKMSREMQLRVAPEKERLYNILKQF